MLVVSTAIIFGLDGCKKPVRGCMDSTATNYNSSADESDGSCAYSGKVVCYLRGAMLSTFSSTGTSTINFYIDGSFIGSLSASTQCLVGEPPCSQTSNVITKIVTLGTSTSKTVRLKCVDEDGFTWVDQDMTVNNAGSGICNIWTF